MIFSKILGVENLAISIKLNYSDKRNYWLYGQRLQKVLKASQPFA